MDAGQGCGLGIVVAPADVLPPHPVVVAALGARDEVPPLVRGQEFPLDPGDALDRGGRDQEDLAARVERAGGALLGQRDRVALAVDVARVLVDLVAEEPADRHRLDAGRGVRAGQEQHAAGEFLDQEAVAAVARARASRTRSRSTGVVAIIGSRRWRLNRRASSTVGRRTRIGPGAWCIDVPEPVVAGLGAAQLRALHEDDPPRRRPRPQGVHDLAQVRRRVGVPVHRRVARAVAEHAVLVGPLADRQPRLRPPARPVGGLVDVTAVLHPRSPGRSARSLPRGCAGPRRAPGWQPGRRRGARAGRSTGRAPCGPC